jgi:uncharacterized protein YcfJ
MRDSLVLGAGTGIAAGAIAGSQIGKDSTENAIKGAVIGGLIGGLASYIIHGSLENRDANVRKDTLMNLEQYEVMGVDKPYSSQIRSTKRSGKCYQTREVDGRTVSVPCDLAGDLEGSK